MTRRAFQPVKPIDPELPKAAVRRAIDQAGGAPRAAITIGVAPPTVYAYADPGVPDEISYARACALSSPTVTAFADHQAQLCGGVFVPIAAHAGSLAELTADALKQNGEAAAELVQAMADGELRDRERAAAILELDQAIAALVHLRVAVGSKRAGD